MLQIAHHRALMTLTIFGNYGTIEACRHTGKVLSYTPEEDEESSYDDIVKIDVKELLDHYGELEVATPQNWDILDVGFWFADERGQVTYCDPELDWREMINNPAQGWQRLPRVITLAPVTEFCDRTGV